MREALRDPELKLKPAETDCARSNGVLSIDMVSADNGEVMASTLARPHRQQGTTPPDFGKLVQPAQLVSSKLNVLLFNESGYYMLQDPVGLQRQGALLGARGDLPGVDSPFAQARRSIRKAEVGDSLAWPARCC